MSGRVNMPEQEPYRKGGGVIPALCNLFGTLILVSVILLFLPMSLPKVLGYEVYQVVSGSMEPRIPVDSLVLVGAAKPSDIVPGDVIAFAGGDSVITHRVVENRVVEGEFVTKGDANALEDLNTVSYDRLIGVVRYHVPVLGALMAALSRPVGKLYAVCFAVCGVMFNMLAGRMRARR